MTYLTVAEVADRLTIGLRSAYRLVGSGDLPAQRFGGSIRVTEADFQSYLARARITQTTKAKAAAKPAPRRRGRLIKVA